MGVGGPFPTQSSGENEEVVSVSWAIFWGNFDLDKNLTRIFSPSFKKKDGGGTTAWSEEGRRAGHLSGKGKADLEM